MLRMAVVFPFSREGVAEEERQRRCDRIVATLSPDTRVSFYHVEGANVFEPNRGPELLGQVSSAAVRQMERAASEGAEVVMMYGGIEPGVVEARTRIKVPVVGTAQSMLAVASQLGARLGLVVYESKSSEGNRALARRYHADHLIVGIRGIEVPNSELYGRREEVRGLIAEAARQLVEQDGATAVCAIGLSMVPSSMSAADLSERLGGVRVLDAERIAVQTAEMIGKLQLPPER